MFSEFSGSQKFNNKVWDNVTTHIHAKGGFTPDMMTDKPVIDLINEIKSTLIVGVQTGIKHTIPIEMDTKLRNDVTMFSGFKTAQELHQAAIALYDNGKLRSFDAFKQEALKINTNYNVNYLDAEYEFAVASAQMASKWAQFEKDGNDYYLQYRTARDGNVREEHRALDGITLPITDPFWDKYFPPNGWRCRCNVVQVSKLTNKQTNPETAMEAGNNATDSPKKAIFRFNPGKKEIIFPEKHPYYKVDEQTRKEVMKAVVKAERGEIRQYAQQKLIGKAKINVEEIDYPIEFTSKGVKEFLNQPHKDLRIKNQSLKYIKELIKYGKYIRYKSSDKENVMIRSYHYIEVIINGEKSYVVIREHSDNKATFYSITDTLKQ